MNRKAILYRMVLPDHVCPYGVAAKEQLEAAGYSVEDRVLSSRDDVEHFKAEHQVRTTPLVVIDDEPIGGHAELKRFLSADRPHSAFS